jgi:hypothetical protein
MMELIRHPPRRLVERQPGHEPQPLTQHMTFGGFI